MRPSSVDRRFATLGPAVLVSSISSRVQTALAWAATLAGWLVFGVAGYTDVIQPDTMRAGILFFCAPVLVDGAMRRDAMRSEVGAT